MKTKRILVYFIILSAFLAGSGFGCKQSISGSLAKKLQPITLQFWGVWDNQSDYTGLIAEYQKLHPNVKVQYRKFRYQEYRQALLEAFAADRGPDILAVHNTWLREYHGDGLLAPMPAKTVMAYPEVQGSVKKELVWNLKANTSPSPSQIKRDFADAVYNDVVITDTDPESGQRAEKVYGLPFSLDTLAMFYNVDLFNNAGITSPPEFWNREFQEDVKKLTIQNNRGEIIQSGAALGGADNIDRSTDILALLMMQNGAEMMSGNRVTFHIAPEGSRGGGYNPGIDALRFYTDFANPAKEVYSWNSTLDNSLDMFATNRLAIMFGYSYMLPQIKAKAPKLNHDIVKFPQIEGNTHVLNYANYWVQSVSKKSQHSEEAWDFIKFIALNDDRVKGYLEATQKPPARRSLVDEMREDPLMRPFVDQVLTAKSWYRGRDAETMENIMKEMIEKVIKGQDELADVVEFSVQKIQQTIN